MDMQSATIPLTRVQKSAQTRQKIIDTALALMRQYGYEQLTVRNICQLAGVSNGSFYHFFDSKDDLVAEYLRKAQEAFQANAEEIGLLEYIVAGYLNLCDSYMDMGVEFTANYYTAKNQAFNTNTRKPGSYMQSLYESRLIEAQQNGDVRDDIPIHMVVHDIQAIVIGNTFDWAVCGGISNLKENMERMLRNYLNSAFTERYFAAYPLKCENVPPQ